MLSTNVILNQKTNFDLPITISMIGDVNKLPIFYNKTVAKNCF